MSDLNKRASISYLKTLIKELEHKDATFELTVMSNKVQILITNEPAPVMRKKKVIKPEPVKSELKEPKKPNVRDRIEELYSEQPEIEYKDIASKLGIHVDLVKIYMIQIKSEEVNVGTMNKLLTAEKDK